MAESLGRRRCNPVSSSSSPVTDAKLMSDEAAGGEDEAAGGQEVVEPPAPTAVTETSGPPSTEEEPAVASSSALPPAPSPTVVITAVPERDSIGSGEEVITPSISEPMAPLPPSRGEKKEAPGEKKETKPSAPPPTSKPAAQMQCKQCHRLGGNHEDWCSLATGSPSSARGTADLAADNPLSMGRYGELRCLEVECETGRTPSNPSNPSNPSPPPERPRTPRRPYPTNDQ